MIGLAGGLLGGFVTARLMHSVLYRVTSLDTTAWLSACGLVLTASAAAGYLPARRAALVNPMAALKAE